VVNQGDTSVQFPENLPDKIEVTTSGGAGNSKPELPEGFTYPNGAKVLAGDAQDITLAFNGGIMVADTSDATGGTVSTAASNGTGYAYAQEGVDQILWTGIGGKSSATATLGTIVVPPGKTLFIGGDLSIDASPGTVSSGGTAATWFSGIVVSDAGGYAEGVQPSILASNGANIGSNAAGKIVFLAGSKASVAGTAAGNFVIGGDLEIHQGAEINLVPSSPGTVVTPFKAVKGSNVVNYGDLTLGNASNVINGALTIKGDATASLATGITFGGDVTVEGWGGLTLGGAVIFNGNLNVAENTTLRLAGNVTFNKEATIEGYLDLNSNTYTVGPAGYLAIAQGGKIGNGDWTGSASQLVEAFKGGTAATAENGRVTFADPGASGANLNLDLEIDDYAVLVELAGQTKFHLNSLTYPPATPPSDFAFPTAPANLEIAEGNYVIWDYATLPNVTVNNGGALKLAKVVTKAGDVTIIGGGRKAVGTSGGAFSLSAADPFGEDAVTTGGSTFAGGLGSLTIGDGTTKTDVTIGGLVVVSSSTTVFAPKISEGTTAKGIIVKKNASLTVGGGAVTAIDIPGKITLEAGDASLLGGIFKTVGSAIAVASFTTTKEIVVNDKAEFDASSLADFGTFEALTKLTVDGTLKIAHAGTGDFFKALQNDIGSATDGQNAVAYDSADVKGAGKAVFAKWAVTAGKDHAFDQILGIKNVEVLSVEDVPNTSGFADGYTKDRGPTKGSSDYTLTVGTIEVPAEGLVVDRNLDVKTEIAFPAVAPLTIDAGIAVSAKGTVVLGKKGDSTTTKATLTPTAANTKLGTVTAAGEFDVTTGGLTLKAGDTLNVPGKLNIIGDAFTAGGTSAANGKLVLGEHGATGANSTYLKDVEIASTVDTDDADICTVAITITGTLSNGHKTESVVGKGSSVVAKKGGTIAGILDSKLEFYGAVIGEGLLVATSETASITTADESTTAGKATFAGDWTATYDATKTAPLATVTVLKSGTTGTLTIADSASVTVSIGGNKYDTVTLAGPSALAKGVAFNAVTGIIDLASGTLTDGILTATGKGALLFATGKTITEATKLDIGEKTTLTGGSTPGVQDGVLDISSGILTVGGTGTFNVGVSASFGDGTDAGSATVIGLTVSSGGKIENKVSITLLGVPSGSTGLKKGKLSFGSSNALVGVASGGPKDAVAGTKALMGSSTDKLTTGANDVYGPFGTDTNSSSNTNNNVTVSEGSIVGGTGSITITGNTSSSAVDTITATSRLISTTVDTTP
jgi:hypothetical protein